MCRAAQNLNQELGERQSDLRLCAILSPRILALIALAAGAGILGDGVDLIRRANTKPEQDDWDTRE